MDNYRYVFMIFIFFYRLKRLTGINCSREQHGGSKFLIITFLKKD